MHLPPRDGLKGTERDDRLVIGAAVTVGSVETVVFVDVVVDDGLPTFPSVDMIVG